MDNNLTQALAILQETQKRLEEAIEKLGLHDTDTESHYDIRQLIKRLEEQDTVYTKEQIRDMIKEGIEAHAATPFKEAHPGWPEYEQTITDAIAQLDGRIKSIEARLDGQEGSNSDLQEALRKLREYYEPQIMELSKLYDAAVAKGDLTAAEEYKQTIDRTAELYRQKIAEVLEAYQNNGGTMPEPTEPDIEEEDTKPNIYKELSDRLDSKRPDLKLFLNQ